MLIPQFSNWRQGVIFRLIHIEHLFIPYYGHLHVLGYEDFS